MSLSRAKVWPGKMGTVPSFFTFRHHYRLRAGLTVQFREVKLHLRHGGAWPRSDGWWEPVAPNNWSTWSTGIITNTDPLRIDKA